MSSNSGPPPDPNALRRDRDKETWTQLPSDGRLGDVPTWPLSKASPRELELWAREWCRPQAVMWEANGQETEVAMYVRSLKDAEKPRASVASRTLVRQQQEALGLSLPGLLRLRWKITDRPTATARPKSTSDTRDRLKVVNGAA